MPLGVFAVRRLACTTSARAVLNVQAALFACLCFLVGHLYACFAVRAPMIARRPLGFLGYVVPMVDAFWAAPLEEQLVHRALSAGMHPLGLETDSVHRCGQR